MELVMHEWILLHNGTIKLFLIHISLLVALYFSSVILSEGKLSLHAALPLFLFFFNPQLSRGENRMVFFSVLNVYKWTN